MSAPIKCHRCFHLTYWLTTPNYNQRKSYPPDGRVSDLADDSLTGAVGAKKRRPSGRACAERRVAGGGEEQSLAGQVPQEMGGRGRCR